MNTVIKTMVMLNYIAEQYANALMDGKLTTTKVKKAMHGKLCNSLLTIERAYESVDASLDDFYVSYNLYYFTFRLVKFAEMFNRYTSEEKIAKACLEVIQWTAEFVNNAVEDNDYE